MPIKDQVLERLKTTKIALDVFADEIDHFLDALNQQDEYLNTPASRTLENTLKDAKRLSRDLSLAHDQLY